MWGYLGHIGVPLVVSSVSGDKPSGKLNLILLHGPAC